MSSEVGVRIAGLGKAYGLYDGPGERLAAALWRRPAPDTVWALRDVSLEARSGDFIGIVGCNGAGKSTLLEILAGTRTPTAGTVEVRGRVAAMLELGAGFNPDFTGRQNARLSALAYGLSPREFEERFPQIVEFAGIGDFIDRPTREYSSGMFARLAFSVCAHVDADILIIDEILGVGDVRFQQRSMRFLRRSAASRIVFFVSHNEAAVLSLCNRAIWLDQGRVARAGSPMQVMHAYQKATIGSAADEAGFTEAGALLPQAGPAAGRSKATELEAFADPADPGAIIGSRLECAGAPARSLSGGETLSLSIRFRADDHRRQAAFALSNSYGQILFWRRGGPAPAGAGLAESRFEFVLPYLPSGAYAVDAVLFDVTDTGMRLADRVEVATEFQVVSRHISHGLANVALREASLRQLEPAS